MGMLWSAVVLISEAQQWPSIIIDLQLIRKYYCVCVCVCVCHFSARNTTHTTQEIGLVGVCVCLH